MLFLTMELVDGKPLSDLIPKGGAPLDQTLGIAIALADAVSSLISKASRTATSSPPT